MLGVLLGRRAQLGVSNAQLSKMEILYTFLSQLKVAILGRDLSIPSLGTSVGFAIFIVENE